MTDSPRDPARPVAADDVEALLRELTADDAALATPPPRVWEGIERRLAGPDADTIDDRDAASPPLTAPATTPLAAPAPPDELAVRRRRRAPRWLAAAACVAIVAGAAVVLIGGRDGDGQVAAVAELAHLDDFDPLGTDAAASARLIDADDHFDVVLDEPRLPEVGQPADLEIWLIATDDAGEIVDLVSLGLVGATDRFEVPSGYDPDTYSVVDISVEPRDGDATHSGRSILRGSFVDA